MRNLSYCSEAATIVPAPVSFDGKCFTDRAMTKTQALVLFSGGQDSTVCLAWALTRFDSVETVGFDYGQRHAAELAARPRLLSALANGFSTLGRTSWATIISSPLNAPRAIGGSALTEPWRSRWAQDGLPTTFVPGRNLMFLTAAAALGYRRGIADLVGGMCETDFSGYPDCRNDTMQATARALSLGLARDVRIHTPLMWIDKAETWRWRRIWAASAGRSDRGGNASPAMKATARIAMIGAMAAASVPACELRAKQAMRNISGTHDL